jgi:hypothetical protein
LAYGWVAVITETKRCCVNEERGRVCTPSQDGPRKRSASFYSDVAGDRGSDEAFMFEIEKARSPGHDSL